MERDRRAVVRYVVGGLAFALTLALAPFFIASGLMAPAWAVAVFIALWVGFVVLAALWIRRHPLRVVPVPFVAAAVWFGGMSAGGAWLGWTA